MVKYSGRLLIFAILLVLLPFVQSVHAGDKTEVPGSGGEVIQIQQGNVGTFHELRLGVANIVKADYVDEAGAKKQGLIAVLSLFIEGNPPQEKDFQVHAGQTITMNKYSVYVEEIRGTTKGLVTLRIEEISKSPTR